MYPVIRCAPKMCLYARSRKLPLVECADFMIFEVFDTHAGKTVAAAAAAETRASGVTGT